MEEKIEEVIIGFVEGSDALDQMWKELHSLLDMLLRPIEHNAAINAWRASQTTSPATAIFCGEQCKWILQETGNEHSRLLKIHYHLFRRTESPILLYRGREITRPRHEDVQVLREELAVFVGGVFTLFPECRQGLQPFLDAAKAFKLRHQ